MTEVLEVLKKARANVEEHWVQRMSGMPGKSCCAVTAISEATGLVKNETRHLIPAYVFPTASNSDIALEAQASLYKALPRNWKGGIDGSALVLYNDKRNTTKQDILDLYDRAIEEAS